jgi:hypothetical protein
MHGRIPARESCARFQRRSGSRRSEAFVWTDVLLRPIRTAISVDGIPASHIDESSTSASFDQINPGIFVLPFALDENDVAPAAAAQIRKDRNLAPQGRSDPAKDRVLARASISLLTPHQTTGYLTVIDVLSLSRMRSG